MRVPIRKPGKYTFQKPDYHITQKKYDTFERRLHSLKAEHPEAATEVQRLAELGDFSENAAYQMAKGRLRSLNSKIEKLEQYLNRAIIIEPDATGRVQIGNTVTVLFDGTEKTFTILGSSETDPAKNIISQQSPIGQALLNKKVGDMFEISLPNKTVECKVLAIK